MPLIIIPSAAYSGGGIGASSQELQTLSEQLNSLSLRISAIEDTLKEYDIPFEQQDPVDEMLDEVFSDDFVDDGDTPQDPEYTELLDDVFSGNDTDDPDNITDDDAELFGDFDDIFNP